jgi:hypothetical protein
MSSAIIYDDLLNIDDLEHIKNTISFSSGTGEENILDALDNFPKKQMLYSLALNINNDITQPCVAHSIAIEKYDNKNKDFIYWEPHHDGKESRVITLLFIDVQINKWVGGELDVYSSLDVFDYPDNKQRIEPVPGRIVVFDSSNVHCIRPYFGNVQRKTISIGWE